jgi:ParB family transcriptional regulator, chromosome partitioning protein
VVVRRNGLGRGLSALIPAEAMVEGEDPGQPALLELPVSAIIANRHQPRKGFDEESLASLTASVRELGVLQPVLVRPSEDGTFELIAGERRWRAAKRAGLDRIPALVRVVDDMASLEQAVVENLHRADLNPLEEAAAYQQLIEEFHLTHEQVATRVGKSRVAVTNGLRLFQLPPGVQKLVAEGQLTGGHAKALLGTPDRAFLEHLARRIVSEGLTVRQVEEAVRARAELEGRTSARNARAAGRTGAAAGAGDRDPGLLELEELLADFLATRVSISSTGGRGRLVIEFADLDDLERIYRQIAAANAAQPSDSDDQVVVEA